MTGTGASLNGTLVALRSLICQMPSQVTSTFLFLKATYCESGATFFGLQPLSTALRIHSSALTPASESNVALLPSTSYGSPPFCHRMDRNIRCAGHLFGIQKGLALALPFSLSRAASKSSFLVGASLIPAVSKDSVL